MNNEITTKVFITVMTYPHPSRGYQELVCTAGITDAGDWVRLYPIDYRYRPRNQQFRKYQWIEIDLLPHGAGNDRRKESRKPNLNTIRIIGAPLSSKNGWAERRRIIDKMPVHTVKQLQALHDAEKMSLGIVRPNRVLDLVIEPADADWKPEWQAVFSQLRLFGPVQKPLRKIPYKFSYVFECEDSNKPHRAMIEDWELGVLWLNEVDRLGGEEKAALSVKRKFFDEICSPMKDTRFFMGTVFPYNTWMVLGLFGRPNLLRLDSNLYNRLFFSSRQQHIFIPEPLCDITASKLRELHWHLHNNPGSFLGDNMHVSASDPLCRYMPPST